MAITKSYVTLDQLDRKRAYRNIHTTVRLLHKWEYINFKKDNELLGMNLLLLDENNNTIQGTMHHSLLSKFGNTLCEGNLIEISNFIVQDCNKSYKVSDHKFMLRITETTKIHSVEQQIYQIPKENFCFQSYDAFVKSVDMTIDLFDAIGYIKHIEKTDVRSKATHALRRVTLTLMLEGGIEIPATLWAEQAEQFEDKYRAVENNNIVLIMTSILVKIYQGAIYLSASSSTKFYFNQDFASVVAFRQSLKFYGECNVNLGRMAVQDKRLGEEEHHSINDIWDFVSSDDQHERKFVCKATITEIVLRNDWNYISCSSCSKKLEKKASSLICVNKKCGKSPAVGVLRFRIEVIVEDRHDSANFVIFDKDATKLTGTTAESIKNNSDEEGMEGLPTCVKSIIGSTHLFEIHVKDYDFKSTYKSFTVSEILNQSKASSEEVNNNSKREASFEDTNNDQRKKPRI
ncbi:Replication protein A 70 kDa DNA-binding subunit B [Cardamine amara subsp. amara]|uniref:Replication protein A 70 kDa DNA-binding subunit B n=1 Tax=Cardamine amara subsp. amara TaxID=228776 RepID=A0ABD1BLS2_CARAN